MLRVSRSWTRSACIRKKKVEGHNHVVTEQPGPTTAWLWGTPAALMGNVWFTGSGSDSLGKLKIPTLDFLLSWFWAASRRCVVETEESKQSTQDRLRGRQTRGGGEWRRGMGRWKTSLSLIRELSSVEAKVFWPPPGRTPSWPKSQVLTLSIIVLSSQSKHRREEKTSGSLIVMWSLTFEEIGSLKMLTHW